MHYVIQVDKWPAITCKTEDQAEEFGAALCLGLCANVKVYQTHPRLFKALVHEFFHESKQ